MPGWGEAVGPFHVPTLDAAMDRPGGTQGGKPTLMLFFGTASHPVAQSALAMVAANRTLFDDLRAAFYGITIDPADERDGRIVQQLPGVRFFLDYDRGSATASTLVDADGSYSPCWLLLDRTWRVAGTFFLPDSQAAFVRCGLITHRPDPIGPRW